ncbi:MAG: CBS domain-containing protein, partial [Planctomycetaceae bacterium]
MDTVEILLDEKARAGRVRPGAGCGPIVTSPEATVREATRRMNDQGIGALIVMRNRRLAGIFTERDVLRRVVAESRSPDTTLVGEVMTLNVLCCSPDSSIDDV